MEKILKEFRHEKVLLIYRCGSYAFGTTTDTSDEDFIVVLKDFKGLMHMGDEGKEYFIFGLPFWKDKMEFSDDLAEYYEVHNDEIFSFPHTVLYIDKEIEPLIEEYRARFLDNYKVWLTKVVRYFARFIELGDYEKRYYHLVRIKHIVENYKTTGTFSLELSPEIIEWIKAYKAEENRVIYKAVLDDALQYLKAESERQGGTT